MSTTQNTWSVDLKTGMVTHKSGMTVLILNGEVEDIANFPKEITTRDLPRMINEAMEAHTQARRDLQKPPRPKTVLPPRTGPKKPLLSLKKPPVNEE